MTLKSARARLSELRRTNLQTDGYCFPMGVDALLPVSELPIEFYEMSKREVDSSKGSHNKVVGELLREFFKVEPQQNTDNPIAKFDAFGDSPQTYFSYAPFDPEKYADIIAAHSEKQVKLRQLIIQATTQKCLVLFDEKNQRGDHTKALAVIDDEDYGGKRSVYRTKFAVRDYTRIDDGCLYMPNELAFGVVTDIRKRYAPLPEVSRPRFPRGQESWELIILPPDPTL